MTTSIILSIILLFSITALAMLLRKHSKLTKENILLNSQLENIRNERLRDQELQEAQLENIRNERLRDQELHEEQLRHLKDECREKLQRAEQDRARLTEDTKRLNRESEERFKNLANEILEANARRFKEQNETRLAEILDPLKENISEFKKTVTETYANEARERFSLQQTIKEMIDINRTIGKEANDLTRALKGNSKIQGDWGEMILEQILEKSGLKKDIHFKVQQTTDDDGNLLKDNEGHSLRPDVVIYYPDGRCVVIDSKVSLTAYVEYANATDETETDRLGRLHLASVRTHIKELSEKNYQDFIGERKTDFVMMFIPNESAYMTAMNLDSNIWKEAYDRRVIIISPTHLISAIRLIEQLWQQDDIKRNALEIAKESGKMYDKFVGFVDDLSKIGKAIENSQTCYDSALRKLKDGPGNLVGKAEKLRQMGAKATKKLPASVINSDDEERESD